MQLWSLVGPKSSKEANRLEIQEGVVVQVHRQSARKPGRVDVTEGHLLKNSLCSGKTSLLFSSGLRLMG